MTKTVTLAEVERFIRNNPDSTASDALPADGFARHLYMNGTQPELANTDPARADAGVLGKWGLTPEQWAEQVKAAARARAHDAKLDMLHEGIGKV